MAAIHRAAPVQRLRLKAALVAGDPVRSIEIVKANERLEVTLESGLNFELSGLFFGPHHDGECVAPLAELLFKFGGLPMDRYRSAWDVVDMQIWIDGYTGMVYERK